MSALLYLSRFFGICAVLAGIGAGLLVASLIAALTCMDSCPEPDQYIARLIPGTVWVLQPYIALEALAFLTFVGYCFATRQARRALTQTLTILIGGLVCVGAFYALFQLCQTTLLTTTDGSLVESSAEAWEQGWGLAIAALSGAWSGLLTYLQWSPDKRRRPSPPSATTSVD